MVFTYDAMGNILTQERHNRAGQKFDDLEYHYQTDSDGNLLRNRLYSVSDDPNLASVMEDDIEDMGAFISAINQINTNNNYSYDAEGRLVKDRQEEIDTIIWTVSGKVKEIRRSFESTKKNLIFEYDAFGNRIAKQVYDNQTLMLEKSTYYILDASGNQLSMYEHIVDDADVKYYLTERNIYGSSRLGTLKDPVNMLNAEPLQSYGILGNRNYELSNHLGNVLTVISDIKYPLSDDNTTITGYEVGISNIFDYSPFGAPLDGRTIQNIFHQEEFTDTFTVIKTIYVLEETFDVASDWQDVASYSQISYPSGKMEVKNPSNFARLIGAKKDFTTGTGQHTVSFEMASLPSGVCAGLPGGGVVMGAQHNKTSDTLAGTGSYQIQSTSPHYVVVEIRNENNALVLKDSTNSTGTYSYAFSAPQGKEYTVSFHNKSMCSNLGFQIDNVFISYDTLEIVTGNTIVVTDTLFIINNDFENPVIEPNGAGVKIDGWTHYSPSTTLSVESHNGSDWLKVVSTNGTHGAHQGFSVEPGETYTFEIDLHRPAGMNKEINVVIWKNTGPSGAYTLHVLNTDGSNTFNYTATSSNIYIQIRQAGTYYLDNIRMYRTYQDTVFVGGFDVDMVYAYGYNTQMRVDEIAGKGNHYTAPYWEYDPRVVHRWNRDPMAFKYPWQSPYVINNNNPIFYTDPYGLEGEEPEETGPRGAEQEDGSFNGYLDLPEVTVSAESRDKTEAQVKEKLRVIQELSNPDWGDRYRRSLTAFKLAHKYVGEYGYSSYDFTRDYRKFGWCDYDPECYKMSVQEQRELRQEWGYNWEEFALFVHNVALYSLLGADFLMMESSLIASPFYSSRVAAKTGSSLVDDVAKHAKSWLGKDYKVITNKAGDNIFMSKDGLRKMRFDIKNPHGDKPHLHLEIFKNGKWRDAIPGNHRIYPK